jgi:uncharacterized membrane protein YgcG
VLLAVIAAAALTGLVPAVLAAGPPFPEPVNNQAVYDTAGVLEPQTIARVEAAIDKIESDTGAEIVVYTQLVPDGVGAAKAKADAIALMDQWGVGRAGIDDGLVILFDLGRYDPCHGQVQLYAGPGFRQTWLSNEDRQAIFENQMLPKLRECDVNGALVAAMDRISMVPTFRVLNAVLGLVLAPLLLVLFIGYGLIRWRRAGRDPVYLDDPSILMPAPPPGLTPAAGAAMRDGGVDRRALTAASLDLAARGQIGFKAVPGGALFSTSPEIGIYTGDAVTGDQAERARMLRARARPTDDATRFLLGQLTSIGGGGGYIDPEDITKLGPHVGGFNSRLEKHLVAEGWFRDRPSTVIARWAGGAAMVLVGGIAAFGAGLALPSSGLVLVGVALGIAAIALFVIGNAMPSRTQDGAVIVAMLEAYRRTLEKTMALSRSMGEVASASAIPLIEGPDDAVVWGVALGLQDDVEAVLQRSAEDRQAGRMTNAWLPMWYMAGSGGFGGGSDASRGLAPGLMSSSPIPNFGGMMAALGTIGNSPASSGSGGAGGGGGFGGGGSGGGGGGAGGGF